MFEINSNIFMLFEFDLNSNTFKLFNFEKFEISLFGTLKQTHKVARSIKSPSQLAPRLTMTLHINI